MVLALLLAFAFALLLASFLGPLLWLGFGFCFWLLLLAFDFGLFLASAFALLLAYRLGPLLLLGFGLVLAFALAFDFG